MRNQFFSSWPGLAIAVSLSALVAPVAEAKIPAVTAVQVHPTAAGVNLMLESSSPLESAVLTTGQGKTLVLDLLQTQLQLPTGQPFRQDHPTDTLAGITVASVDPNRIRLTLTGTEQRPTATVTQTPQGLVFTITTAPPPPPAASLDFETSEDSTLEDSEAADPIDLVVTASPESDEPKYFVPQATTATKVETPLLDIPQSIQVIPRQVIEDQQIIRAPDALRNVSGVIRTEAYGGATDNYTIRGFAISNNLRNGFKDPGFYSYHDVANLERLEVLKGPASILYGQIEPGGIVNYVTKQPLREPYASGQAIGGSFGLFRPSLDVSGPLNSDQTLLYRLNAAYETTGSFRDFVNHQVLAIAPVVRYQIGQDTDLTLEYEYTHLRRTFDRGFLPEPEFLQLPISRYLGEPSDFYDRTDHKTSYVLDHRFSDTLRLRNAFSAQIHNAIRSNVQSRTFRLGADGRTLQRRFSRLSEYEQDYSLQTDLIGRFDTGSIRHNWLMGVELSRSVAGYTFLNNLFPAIDIFNPIYGFPLPADPISAFSSEVAFNNVGVYLQNQMELLPNLLVLMGGRLDFVHFDGTDIDDVLGGSTPLKTQRYYEAFSPRVGLVYQPSESLSLYASYTQSFRPNFLALTANRQPLEPERGMQYEVGIKGEFLDGRLAATLAAYEITKGNVATPDLSDPTFSVAAGEVKSRGIELDIAGAVAPGWNVIASYALNDAFVSRDNSFPVGDKLVNAPAHSASLWTTYEFQSGDLKGLGFGGGLFFVGDRQATLPNSLVIPAYLRTDATLFYRQENYRLALNIKNLFNIRYYDSHGFLLYPGAPLTFLGTVAVQF